MIITDVLDFDRSDIQDNSKYSFGGDRSFRFDLSKEALDPLPDAPQHSFLYYLNERRNILAVQHIADINFQELNVADILATASENNALNIYMVHWPSWKQEPEELKMPNGAPLIVPKNFVSSSNEIVQEETLNFIKLAKKLKENEITTIDIVIEHRISPNGRWSAPFSSHVSRELFPGLQKQVSPFCGLDSLENKKLKTPKQYEAAYKAIKIDAGENLKEKNTVTAYGFSVEHEYGGYLTSYPLPVTNNLLIPGLLEGRRPMADRLIQSIAYQNENPHAPTTSLVFIVNKHEEALTANAEDILFAKEVRESAEKYKVPVDDIILLGQYDATAKKHQTLKI